MSVEEEKFPDEVIIVPKVSQWWVSYVQIMSSAARKFSVVRTQPHQHQRILICSKQSALPRTRPGHTCNQITSKMDAKDAFSAYYLQRATKEVAEDLDKLRDARDFKSESVQVLVHAIQQGSTSFPPAERTKVAVAGQSAGGSPEK